MLILAERQGKFILVNWSKKTWKYIEKADKFTQELITKEILAGKIEPKN